MDWMVASRALRKWVPATNAQLPASFKVKMVIGGVAKVNENGAGLNPAKIGSPLE